MDKDIQEMFRSKNREILITNLKFDLEKNFNSLLDTVTNIYNLEFDTAITKLIAILNDANINDNDIFITEIINKLKLDSYKIIEEISRSKKDKLDKKIDKLEFVQEEMNNYYEFVFATTKDLKSTFELKTKKLFEKVDLKLEKNILKIVDESQEELTCSRAKDYLNNRLYGKLETKIHMEVMLRDNNLINKAKEGYERFQEIMHKTIKN